MVLLRSKWAAQRCPLARKPWGGSLYKRLEKPMEARGTKIIFMPPLRCRMLSRVWRSSAALRPPLASASLKREAIIATIAATCIPCSSCLRRLQATLHPLLQAGIKPVSILFELEAGGHIATIAATCIMCKSCLSQPHATLHPTLRAGFKLANILYNSLDARPAAVSRRLQSSLHLPVKLRWC